MSRIGEPASEKFLYHLWETVVAQMSPLAAVDGRLLQVREPGCRNTDAGPDYLSALIVLDGEMLRGDIEIHPVAGDWYQHGHHLDPRYNRVILHVITDECPAGFSTYRQDGVEIPVFNLDSCLDPNAEILHRGLDPATRWASHFTVDCALAQTNPSRLNAILDQAGQRWLQIKALRWSERRMFVSWDQTFYEALFEALGYAKNSIPFLNLAQQLTWDLLRTVLLQHPGNQLDLCCAALFSTAGLLRFGQEHYAQRFPAAALAIWQKETARHAIHALCEEDWTFFRLRPNNFPPVRLFAAADLVCRFLEKGFLPVLLARTVEGTGLPRQQVAALIGAVADIAGLGIDRSRDIAINAILPVLLAYAWEAGDAKLGARLMNLLAYFPLLTSNTVSRSVRRQLGLEPCHRLTTRQQQGGIYLYRWVCAQSGPCNRCLHSLEPAR